MDLNRVTTKPKRERYSSHSDPRYLRLLESSRAWKERNKDTPEYKAKKAAQDSSWYLQSRDTEKFRKERRERNRRWRSNGRVKEIEAERVQKFLEANPERKSAYQKVQYALRVGKLVRPKNCQKCGCIPEPRKDGRSGIQAHHEDYDKPLEVIWLCGFCHAEIRRLY